MLKEANECSAYFKVRGFFVFKGRVGWHLCFLELKTPANAK